MYNLIAESQTHAQKISLRAICVYNISHVNIVPVTRFAQDVNCKVSETITIHTSENETKML